MRTLSFVMLVTAGCAAADSEDRALMLPDAGIAADAPPDADVTCESVLPDPVGAYRGKVGGLGGGKGPLLACDDVSGDRIVGVALRMSNQNTSFGGRSAHGIAIACAPVTIDAAGNARVGTEYVREVSGTGTGMWSPSTMPTITNCKPGWVVTGLKAHVGTDRNRFIDATVTCSKLGADGKPGVTEAIKVIGSFTDAVNPDEVKCATGAAVAQLGTWTGAGIDAVDLICSAPACR